VGHQLWPAEPLRGGLMISASIDLGR
jgi:hypothetical protein